MITLNAQIEMLRESRQEKLALTALVGLMTDSLETSIKRLEDLQPIAKKMEDDSRKVWGKKNRLEIDHDIALKIHDLVDELLPWLKSIADLDKQAEDKSA